MTVCYNESMTRKRLIFYYIIFFTIMQVFGVNLQIVSAVAEEQNAVIVSHCSLIKDDLKKVQKEDARVRVYLGGYYEAILTKFITPLNVRLVENNLSNASLVENQNKFVETKTTFVNDFIKYQQELEELVGIDCKDSSEVFYDKLQVVRQKRKIMAQDVLKMRSLISEHIKLVDNLKGKI